MARKLGNVNPNEALRSMVAVDIEALSMKEVLTATTPVSYVVQSEAPFLVLVADKAFYFDPIGGTAAIRSGMRWPADVPLKIPSPSAKVGDTAITEATTIIENSDTDKSDYEVGALVFKMNGVAIEKAAEDNIAFDTAWTINSSSAATVYWGAVLIQITAAGVVSSKVVLADQLFLSEAEAIDNLPAADANNIPIGYITIECATSDKFTANTEELNANDAAVDSITFYSIGVAEFARFMGPEQLGPVTESHVGQVVSLDAPESATLVYVAEVH